SPSFPTRRSSDLSLASNAFAEVSDSRAWRLSSGVLSSAAKVCMAWGATLWREIQYAALIKVRLDTSSTAASRTSGAISNLRPTGRFSRRWRRVMAGTDRRASVQGSGASVLRQSVLHEECLQALEQRV